MEFMMGLTIVASIALMISLAAALMYATFKIADLRSRNKELKKDNVKILHQKKSSEVRLGKIGENMAPFFTEWPYDPNAFRFLGNPVDGIQFTDDEVIFVEIKTGKARLSNSQKSIKRLVTEGKVRFATFRVGEDGCTLKVEED